MEELEWNILFRGIYCCFVCLFGYEDSFYADVMESMRRWLRQAVFKDEEGRLWMETNKAMVFAQLLGLLVFTGVS